METMNVKDKIILVTGSSDGIGKQTAIDLAALGAHVIVHGRHPDRTSGALHEVKIGSGSDNLSSVSGDLSSFEAIRTMAAEIHSRFGLIDVLINNAGVFMQTRKISNDGIEMTFAVNHLAYFLFTGLLLDLIEKSACGRIINVASQAHARQLDFENLQGELFFEGYDAYSRSKLCNILFTYYLAEKLKGLSVTVNAMHPGVIRTKLLHAGWGAGGTRLSEGSATSVFLAAAADVNGVSGKYFSNRRLATSSAISYDHAVQQRLWEVSESITGFSYSSG